MPIDNLAIAWNGSRVGARAVAEAQLLLERAARILNDKPLMEMDTGERLAEGLQRHDLDAMVVAIDTKDCPIA